ncbi:hypothetical protein JOQ06_013488 [Pogonophryne albipinna]|uniref:Major facilitator superfamily (MFS) profile domain-containing protein n=1 Tax=Pogonophryne albipinna TaxID=1090488 RepID=A0AAD6BK21_9TELE|nr:hypothetical protein JOQ06_013488 [Pogonophryne albipinna]
MKFENVLAEVDGFGRFQLMIILMTVIPRMTLPLHFLLNNFVAIIPSHHCDISSLDDGGYFGNLSQEERLIVGIPVQEDGTPNSCQMFAEPQSSLATEWDLVCDKRKMNRATATIFFLGVMFGAAAFGFISDRFGRKNSLLVSYVTTSLFGFTSALSYNFTMFAVMRFLTGFGISGISIASIVLCIEWVDIKHRTKVGVLMSLDWSIFTALLPVVAYFVNDWRVLTATATSLLILAMISWWWLPESARWLISNGKVKAAHFYLKKCAKVNGREQFMADLKPESLSKVILVENENRKYSCEDPQNEETGYTHCHCLVWSGLPDDDMGLFRTAVGALGKMFAEASFTCVYLYTTELYPTVMRQNGLGYSSFMGRLGVSVSPLIILLEEVWGHLPSTIFSLVAFTAGLTCYLLPETQNIRLPETIEEVEHPRRRSISASDEKSQP